MSGLYQGKFLDTAAGMNLAEFQVQVFVISMFILLYYYFIIDIQRWSLFFQLFTHCTLIESKHFQSCGFRITGKNSTLLVVNLTNLNNLYHQAPERGQKVWSMIRFPMSKQGILSITLWNNVRLALNFLHFNQGSSQTNLK